MADATSAFGTLLQMGDGATPTEGFTTVAEVTDISGPELSTEEIDVTHHQSPSVHREYIPSLRDSGSITFSVNYLPANATHINASGGLLYAWENRSVGNWRVTWTDTGATSWTITGFISSFSPTAPIDDKLAADVTIRVTAAPTIN